MPETRKKYDREFREGAVRIVEETGKPIGQAPRRPGAEWTWLKLTSTKKGMLMGVTRPRFQLPFPCGERWRLQTYPDHHPIEKLDMFAADGGPTEGRTVVASADGRAYGVYAPNTSGGNQVAIDHGNRWVTLHLHLQNGSLLVPPNGRSVHAGDPIAKVDSTGQVSAAHLHYEQIRDASVKSDGEVVYGIIVRAEFDGVAVNVTPPHAQVLVSNNCTIPQTANTAGWLMLLTDTDPAVS